MFACLSTLLTSGCRGGGGLAQEFAQQAGTAAGRAAQNADTVAGGLRPRSAPTVVLPRLQAQEATSLSEQQAAEILRPHAQEASSAGELRDQVKGACIANDLLEVGRARTWPEAASKALVSFGGSATLRFRVENLGKDLDEAENRQDAASKWAVFSICESV